VLAPVPKKRSLAIKARMQTVRSADSPCRLVMGWEPYRQKDIVFIASGVVSPVTSTHLFKSSGGLRSMRMRQIRIDDLQVPIGHLRRT
jgi:hypothetical protein